MTELEDDVPYNPLSYIKDDSSYFTQKEIAPHFDYTQPEVKAMTPTFEILRCDQASIERSMDAKEALPFLIQAKSPFHLSELILTKDLDE